MVISLRQGVKTSDDKQLVIGMDLMETCFDPQQVFKEKNTSLPPCPKDIANGAAEVALSDIPWKCWYLPHFDVFN